MQRNTTKSSGKSNAKPAKTTAAEPPRATQAGGEPESVGRAHAQPSPDGTTGGNAGSERALDEARQGGPRYGGGSWEVADERGDRRYGHARNDDGEPAEVARRAAESDSGELPVQADPELDDVSGEIESGGQHAGMGRGEKPRKLKSEE